MKKNAFLIPFIFLSACGGGVGSDSFVATETSSGLIQQDLRCCPSETTQQQIPVAIQSLTAIKDEQNPKKFTFTAKGYGGNGSYICQWDFGDNTTDNSDYKCNGVTHTFTDDGIYRVTVTLCNQEGTDCAFGGITVNTQNGQLTIESISALPPSATSTPLSVAFGVRVLSSDNNLSYEWDFGDGKNDNVQNPTHLYESEGGYIAKVTVKDSSDNTTDAFLNVRIFQPEQQTQVCSYEEKVFASPKTVTFNVKYTSNLEFGEPQVMKFQGCKVEFIPLLTSKNEPAPSIPVDLVKTVDCRADDLAPDEEGKVTVTLSHSLIEYIDTEYRKRGITLPYKMLVTVRYLGQDGETEYVQTKEYTVEFSDFINGQNDACSTQ